MYLNLIGGCVRLNPCVASFLLSSNPLDLSDVITVVNPHLFPLVGL